MATVDIVGNIRLSDERRLAYLVATIKSVAPLAPLTRRFLLNIENGQGLVGALRRLVRDAGFRQTEVSAVAMTSYGAGYIALLRRASADYIMHFEEDHFCVLEDATPVARLLDFAHTNAADIVPLSFHELYAERFAMLSPQATDPTGRLFRWDRDALWRVRQRDPECFFVGTNALFSREFGLAFWTRPISGSRPHSFEVFDPTEGASLRLVLPSFEVLRPIDDDHGIEGSSCLRSGGEKWTRLAGEGLRGVGLLRCVAWRAAQARDEPVLKKRVSHFAEAMKMLVPRPIKQVIRFILRRETGPRQKERSGNIFLD